MHSDQDDTIYPCPFSKGYGIPTRQAWLLLKIFFIYRFISASLFVMLFFLRFGPSSLGKYDAQLYQFTSLSYLAISLLSVPFVFRRLASYTQLSQVFIFTDIVFITLLMHASGGVTSGVGGLLAVSIAAGGLLIGGRCAILFAALATLAVLAEEVYAIQTHLFNAASLNYSGLLGISFFTIALLSLVLAQRAEQSARLVKQHAHTIVRLEELNRYIIQHLQSGIMIVDEQQAILLCNQSVLRLLELGESPKKLADVSDISDILQQAFSLWCANPEQDFAIIKLPSLAEIQVRFSMLTLEDEHLHMLIFEDIALYNQRLQQSKLASLGRLSASIAHEIRNPLSAISHAGQLLSESPELKAQDLRLTEIIQTHCRRVNNIIEDILKLSRRNASQKQKIALQQWLPAYIKEQLPGQGESFELKFKQLGLNVYIDPGHLKQILDNLCANALKYGNPAKGKIVIEADQVANTPCIRIIDNGPGISPENLQHLFEPFFTTSHQGTGLGLYISRELAELNRAELSYAKCHEKSCFILSLANADHAVIEI